MPETCTIYFIQVGDDGPIKIGHTIGSPLARLNAMQTGSPYELRVIATIPDAPFSLEGELHRRFVHLRIRGEWFRPASEIEGCIREMGRSWNPDVAMSSLVAKVNRDRELTKEERRRRLNGATKAHNKPAFPHMSDQDRLMMEAKRLGMISEDG